MLTSLEKTELHQLIKATKGLSPQGNKARCTVTLSLQEIKELQSYGDSVGLGVSGSCKYIIQQFIQQLVAQKSQTN